VGNIVRVILSVGNFVRGEYCPRGIMSVGNIVRGNNVRGILSMGNIIFFFHFFSHLAFRTTRLLNLVVGIVIELRKKG
jgi:hypothetical protein